MSKYKHIYVSDFFTIDSFVSFFNDEFKNALTPETPDGGDFHDFWEFLFLERGNINLLVDGKIHYLKPGQLIMYPPNSHHSCVGEENAIVTLVSFSTHSSLPYKFVNNIIELTEKQKIALRKITSIGKNFFSCEIDNTGYKKYFLREDIPEYKMHKVAKLTEILLIDLYESTLHADTPKVQNSNDYKNEQFDLLTLFLKENINKSFTLEQLSKELHIGTSTLSKLCKVQCGCGPIDYFISLKIGVAKQMIADTNMNLTKVSEKLGFSSIHYFSKIFKAKTGITPSRYAKSVNE